MLSRVSRNPLHARAIAVAILFILLPWSDSPVTGQIPAAGAIPKYVFFFLADGAGMTHLEIARQYRREIEGREFVIVDKIMKDGHLGVMTTHAANSLSTDSAAAATALAVGCKANIGALGICADGRPEISALEIARRRGMRLGLITNAAIYDASPAAFVCRMSNRRDFAAIVDRYLDLEPHVLLGGGRDQFLPRYLSGSRRADERNMIAAFEEKGYRTVASRRELETLASGKVLGLFALSDITFELDRDRDAEPSVYDMTRAAIRILRERNPGGFFAFIESEHIDSAGHLTDVASVIHEYRELDRAVELAYEFYRSYPRETLILVTSDHETGGLGFTQALKDLGSTTGSNRASGTLEDLKKIGSIKISLRKASELLGRNPTPEAVDRLMQEHFPGFVLAPEFKAAIVERRPLSRTLFTDLTAQALGMMIAHNTQVYWQTSAHTNQPVLVGAIGVGAEHFRGYYDNADFGMKLKAVLEGNAHR